MRLTGLVTFVRYSKLIPLNLQAGHACQCLKSKNSVILSALYVPLTNETLLNYFLHKFS